MRNVVDFLTYDESPAVLDVYTPCQAEHGIGDDGGANRRSRLAVESRMNPVFVHDPRAGSTLHERFSLEGNPDVELDWTTATLEYVDDEGVTELLDVPLTPADFALREGRFKNIRPLAPDAAAVPLHEYVLLGDEARYGKTPFVYTTGDGGKLIRLAVLPAIVALVEERRRNWLTLQYLAGLHVGRLQRGHAAELEAWGSTATRSRPANASSRSTRSHARCRSWRRPRARRARPSPRSRRSRCRWRRRTATAAPATTGRL